MSPAIRDYAARVGIDRTKQSAQRIVKADNENRRADRLQILRHKTHPKLFACANHENGDEQDDEIAFKPEESSERFQHRHVRVLSDSLGLFKSTREQKLRRFHSRPAGTGVAHHFTVGPGPVGGTVAEIRLPYRTRDDVMHVE